MNIFKYFKKNKFKTSWNEWKGVPLFYGLICLMEDNDIFKTRLYWLNPESKFSYFKNVTHWVDLRRIVIENADDYISEVGFDDKNEREKEDGK